MSVTSLIMPCSLARLTVYAAAHDAGPSLMDNYPFTFPYVPVTGGTFTGSVNFGRHIHGTLVIGTVAAAAGAGTNPPAPVVSQGSTDLGGSISWGTGTLPNTQIQLTIAFGAAWVIPGGGGPHVVVTASNTATQALGLFVSGVSPTGFNLGVTNAPSASQGNTVYAFSYVVMG